MWFFKKNVDDFFFCDTYGLEEERFTSRLMFNDVPREDDIKEAVFKDGSIDIPEDDVDVVGDIFFHEIFTAVDTCVFNVVFVVEKSIEHGSIGTSNI